MISPKFLWDYGHSTIQIWRRYNKLEGKGFTSGWCASLKNASKPRANLVPRFLSYSSPERKRNLGRDCYHYRPFSHDVTATIFVYKTMNRRPCLCTKNILWELNSFLMLKLFFHSKQFAKLLTMPRDWKRSIDQQPSKPLILLVPITCTTYYFQG